VRVRAHEARGAEASALYSALREFKVALKSARGPASGWIPSRRRGGRGDGKKESKRQGEEGCRPFAASRGCRISGCTIEIVPRLHLLGRTSVGTTSRRGTISRTRFYGAPRRRSPRRRGSVWKEQRPPNSSAYTTASGNPSRYGAKRRRNASARGAWFSAASRQMPS
jgi:hypothetical protein